MNCLLLHYLLFPGLLLLNYVHSLIKSNEWFSSVTISCSCDWRGSETLLCRDDDSVFEQLYSFWNRYSNLSQRKYFRGQWFLVKCRSCWLGVFTYEAFCSMNSHKYGVDSISSCSDLHTNSLNWSQCTVRSIPSCWTITSLLSIVPCTFAFMNLGLWLYWFLTHAQSPNLETFIFLYSICIATWSYLMKSFWLIGKHNFCWRFIT